MTEAVPKLKAVSRFRPNYKIHFAVGARLVVSESVFVSMTTAVSLQPAVMDKKRRAFSFSVVVSVEERICTH